MAGKQCPACKGTGQSREMFEGKASPCGGCGGTGEIDDVDPDHRDRFLRKHRGG